VIAVIIDSVLFFRVIFWSILCCVVLKGW